MKVLVCGGRNYSDFTVCEVTTWALIEDDMDISE
jgi:hypothetical protein